MLWSSREAMSTWLLGSSYDALGQLRALFSAIVFGWHCKGIRYQVLSR